MDGGMIDLLIISGGFWLSGITQAACTTKLNISSPSGLGYDFFMST
jgi:hypothetical protein